MVAAAANLSVTSGDSLYQPFSSVLVSSVNGIDKEKCGNAECFLYINQLPELIGKKL
jgi:hypothetical protein